MVLAAQPGIKRDANSISITTGTRSLLPRNYQAGGANGSVWMGEEVAYPKGCSRRTSRHALGGGDRRQPPSITVNMVLEQITIQRPRAAWEKVKNPACASPKKPPLQETAYCEQDSAASAEPELRRGHRHQARWEPGCRVGSRAVRRKRRRKDGDTSSPSRQRKH